MKFQVRSGVSGIVLVRCGFGGVELYKVKYLGGDHELSRKTKTA